MTNVTIKSEFTIPKKVWEGVLADLREQGLMIKTGMVEASNIDYVAFAAFSNGKVVKDESKDSRPS